MKPANRLEVVAGIVVRPGEALFSRRAAHQSHSGRWEFPGGKVESGESKPDALARELYEEIGIVIHNPLFLLDFFYPRSALHLHFYLITSWDGDPHPREGQLLQWQAKSAFGRLALLPANRRLLNTIIAAVAQHCDLLENSTKA